MSELGTEQQPQMRVHTEHIALVGTPNSGKTTLFNWLTGRRQKVVNYPGSTVDISLGGFAPGVGPDSENLYLIDTPGTYSLFAKSPDEEVTVRTLFDPKYQIRKVIVVMDSTQLDRQVHLVRQIQEAGFEVFVAVTMHDLHLKENSAFNLQKLAEQLGAPVHPIDGVLGGGVKTLAEAVVKTKLQNTSTPRPLEPWAISHLQDVFREGVRIASEVTQKKLKVFEQTEKIDRILLHPVWGVVLFLAIMFGLFSSIYWAAAPAMDAVDAFFAQSAESARQLLGEGLFGQFISDGVITGLGAVLVFVPQIFILFIGISLLEDSGYLARAAALIDRPLSKMGLSGKSFVPLLSGFACAVPAMMAARSINGKKEKWIAMFVIPFMTCSARLPVYTLLVGFLFASQPWLAGLVLAGLYVASIVLGAVASLILSKIIPQQGPSFFMLEMPLYRRPKFQVVFRNSLKRTKSYLVKTAPIILALSVVLWVLSTFPNYQEVDVDQRLQTSYVSHLGQSLEPVFEPMGVDWRVGVGLLTAFAAREVFVSSLAVMFGVTGEDDDSLSGGLRAQMKQAHFEDGTPIFTAASIVSLLLFFMIALQCMSTFATARQEMSSVRFAIVQLVTMNLIAYVVAVVAHSIIS